MDQKQEAEVAAHAEQFESIPWANLVPDRSSRYRRALVIGVTIVAGVIIGLVGGRILRSMTNSGVVVSLPPVAAADPPAAGEPVVAAPLASGRSEIAVPTTVGDGSVLPTPLPPQLYSEADLMAVMPEEEMRAALMRAEWFVTDFFTVDGASSPASDVVAALPDGHDGVPLPHGEGSGISYVEWARAFRVEPLGPARYRVSVAFRTLAGPSVGSLVRRPVLAASVDVEVSADGATGVLDFPSPLPAPSTLALPAIDLPEMDAPPEILAGTVQAATAIGTDPAPLLAGLGEDGWRVVVLVGDESGLRWPLVVRD